MLPLGEVERRPFMQRQLLEAELISWLCMPQVRGPYREDLADWVYEIPAHTPEGVMGFGHHRDGGVTRPGRRFDVHHALTYDP